MVGPLQLRVASLQGALSRASVGGGGSTTSPVSIRTLSLRYAIGQSYNSHTYLSMVSTPRSPHSSHDLHRYVECVGNGPPKRYKPDILSTYYSAGSSDINFHYWGILSGQAHERATTPLVSSSCWTTPRYTRYFISPTQSQRMS